MEAIEWRTLRPTEREAFLDLMAAAFVDEDTAHFARYLDTDPRLGPDDTLVAVAGGRLVSAVQIFTRDIGLRGETLRLGGIGSVATHPDHEGRGHASRLLRRAVEEMTSRGMALSLLFTGRVGFYERLGWVSIPHPVLAVRPPSRGASPGAAGSTRPWARADLPAVKSLYAGYAHRRDGATRRDDAYWDGQLRFAGNPGEDFVVAERAGAVVAYARRIRFLGMARIMEHAAAPDGVGALAALLLGLAPSDGPLFVPACDPELEGALAERGATCDEVAFPDQMWRVLDRERLVALAGAPATLDDRALLSSLVSGPEAVYWPSDRF